MPTNEEQERERSCKALMQEKDTEKKTEVMQPEERDRALEVCRLLQVERNVDRFTALCEELNELLEGMHGPAAN